VKTTKNIVMIIITSPLWRRIAEIPATCVQVMFYVKLLQSNY